MWNLFLTTWRAGVRGRAIRAVLVVAALLVFVAYLASSFSPRQPQTVALDVGFSGLRFSLVLFALFWVEQLVGREISSKGILLALAYPVPRSHYLLARYLGVISLMAMAAIMIGLMLWIAVFMSGAKYDQSFRLAIGHAYWISVLGLWCDAAVVAAFAVMMASISTVSMLPMALGLGFAIAGKSLGAVLDYFARGADGDAELMAMAPVLNWIQWFLPDLSRLDWRVWSMYGTVPSGIGESVLMGVGYIAILLSVGAYAFNRREFV